MTRLLTLVLLLVPTAMTQAQPPLGPTVLHITVPREPPPRVRALRYALLPPAVDVLPGNAAPQWLRAGLAASSATRKLTAEDWTAFDVPLAALPVDRVKKVLDGCGGAFSIADRAAHMEHCYWEFPPLTIETIGLNLPEIQEMRQIAQLLVLRCRVALREGRYDEAARAMQTGFALARHIGEGPMLIHVLVGIAIEHIMLNRVEEWMQQPGAPELYWPLTALPVPLVSVAPALQNEAGTLYRSFPRLRAMAREALSKEQAEALGGELIQLFAPLAGDKRPAEWQAKLAMAALAVKSYPEAKKWLIEHGRTEADVEAMPTVQAVLLFNVSQYDAIWDDMLKLAQLPYWQAQPGYEGLEKQVRSARTDNLNVFVGLLMPAVIKSRQAEVRSQRLVAGLRCAEAIRLHAARHDGRLPTALKDVTEAPLPIDPVTGKSFDDFYKVGEDGKAVLEVPPTPGQPASTGRRFDFAPSAK